MPKKYEVTYILTFHVEAEDKEEASGICGKALFDYLKNLGWNPYAEGFQQQITEVKE